MSEQRRPPKGGARKAVKPTRRERKRAAREAEREAEREAARQAEREAARDAEREAQREAQREAERAEQLRAQYDAAQQPIALDPQGLPRPVPTPEPDLSAYRIEQDDYGAVDDERSEAAGSIIAGGAAKTKRRGRGCILAGLVIALVLGLVGFGAWKGLAFLQDYLADPPDYTGQGRGKVIFEVKEGDLIAEIGRNLKSEGVVKSVDAFTEAASTNPDSKNIQVGFYQLRKQMPAAAALDVLVDPENLIDASVTVPEGLRATAIVELLVKETDFSKKEYEAVLKQPKQIGLPDYAEGNPEGYLFPSTYTITPETTAKSLLQEMVAKWQEVADAAGLEEGAQALGYTPHEIMTVAAMVEAEAANDKDRGKVARVLYNRLEDPSETGGKLQIDATTAYGLGFNPGVQLTPEQLDDDSPYNTRKYAGLPPGPIESPGEASIKAALDPTKGPWFYYITVNLETGETRFTDDYDEFLLWKNTVFKKYCETSDAC